MSGAVVPAQWWCSEMGESSRDGALWRLGVSLRRRESGDSSRDGGLRGVWRCGGSSARLSQHAMRS